MATATAERTRTRSLSSATSIPKEDVVLGDDGYPVKMWEVNGELVAFSLRPFTDEERKVYWNPQGHGAPMWWKAQKLNDWGHQVTVQREVWIAGQFSPRNAWEEYMTLDWLRDNVKGGSAGPTWVGNDNPKSRPGDPHFWVCTTCKWACGVLACLEQHLLMQQHDGFKSQ